MKKWCRHIKWRSGIARDTWEIKVRSWAEMPIFVQVPKTWKQCPICEALRPSRANIAAAKMRALLDAGDEE